MEIKVKKIINSPAENIWKTVRAFDKVERYSPLVISSKITGVDEGSKRVCTVQLGDQQTELLEKLDAIDESKKIMKISVTSGPPPFAGLQVTIQVKSLDINKTELVISTEMQGNEEQTAAGIKEVFNLISDGLKKLHEFKTQLI